MEYNAMDCCSFVIYVSWFVLHAGCELTTPNPSAIKVPNFAIRKLVLIYIHKKETKDSHAPAAQRRDDFCHVLFGAIGPWLGIPPEPHPSLGGPESEFPLPIPGFW
jgi:hypothetical protein